MFKFFLFIRIPVILEKEMATHSRSCLENSMNRGAWWATAHGVAESDTTEQKHTHMHQFYWFRAHPNDHLNLIISIKTLSLRSHSEVGGEDSKYLFCGEITEPVTLDKETGNLNNIVNQLDLTDM